MSLEALQKELREQFVALDSLRERAGEPDVPVLVEEHLEVAQRHVDGAKEAIERELEDQELATDGGQQLAVRECPFPDCQWTEEFNPEAEYQVWDSEARAASHYEEEHVGRLRVRLVYVGERMYHSEDPKDVRSALLEEYRDELPGFGLAHVVSEVIQEPDDHSVLDSEPEIVTDGGVDQARPTLREVLDELPDDPEELASLAENDPRVVDHGSIVAVHPYRDDDGRELVTDGGTESAVRERTLNPETHIDPEDYLDLIYERDAAIHFYLKDDKEWWIAHGPAEQPDGDLDGPWLFWFHWPSGGWELEYLTEPFARFHLGELWYGPVGERQHSIHRARLVPMADAPRFVQEVVGWNTRSLDTASSREADGR